MSATLAAAKVLQNTGRVACWARNSFCSCSPTHNGIYKSMTLPLTTNCFRSITCTKCLSSFDNSTAWHDIRAETSSHISSEFIVLQLGEVTELIKEEGGADIVVIAVPEKMCYVEHFIVATAISQRHVVSITEMVNKLYKKKRKYHQPYTSIEGKRHSDDWQCIDIGNIVVHIMLEKARSLYNLEELWLLGPKYDEELHKAPVTEDILSQMSKRGLNLMSMTDDSVRSLGNIDFDSLWHENDSELPPVPQEGDKDRKTHLEDDDAFLV